MKTLKCLPGTRYRLGLEIGDTPLARPRGCRGHNEVENYFLN